MISPAIKRARLRNRLDGSARSRGLVATHHALYAQQGERRCDLCEKLLSSDPREDGGRGLLVWVRGSEVRYEEPPLCAHCGSDISLAAHRRWAEEDEDEG